MRTVGVWCVVFGLVVACGGKQEGGGPPAFDGVGSVAGAAPELPSGPSAQGAALFELSSSSPPIPGKMCPAGASVSAELPRVAEAEDKLDATTYVHRVIDAEDGAAVKCRISGSGSYELSGRIAQGGTELSIKDGSVSGGSGTATIALAHAAYFPGQLSAPAPCELDVSTPNLQIGSGRVWARFSCATVEAAPSSLCAAKGYFVLENCEKD